MRSEGAVMHRSEATTVPALIQPRMMAVAILPAPINPMRPWAIATVARSSGVRKVPRLASRRNRQRRAAELVCSECPPPLTEAAACPGPAMPRKFGGEDTRGLKAKAQKAAAADEKAAKSRAERKRAEDKEWAEGGNSRAASKAEAQAAKDAKRAADRLLKREIELKEAAELGAGGKGVLRGAAKVAARR